MTSDNLWITARRALGVYFLVIAALNVPPAVAVFGYETANIPRWALLIVPLGQGVVALVAGWWLLRRARAVREEQVAASPGFLAPVLVLMGVYLVVDSVAVGSSALVEMYSFGEAWQVRTGNLANAAVRLVAGLALMARSSEIAQRIAALGKSPA